MRFHLAMHRAIDFNKVARESAAGEQPRHGIAMLSERLGGTIHLPGPADAASASDRLLARVVGRPEHWAMARDLARKLGPDDVVYCPGEEVGFPVAAVCGGKARGPKVAVFVNNVNRPRALLAMKLFGLARKVALFVTNIDAQAEYVRQTLRLPDSRVVKLWDATDVKFFTPGPPSAGKRRPVVASVGLEQRDYRTLAQATHDLDADVRISGFSTDAAPRSKAFPDELPANMTRRFYSWPDLLQLYRDADVVAVSVFPCRYTAGITSVMESLACRRPLVVTRTEGLADYLTPEAMDVVPPGDPVAMRQAIAALLDDPTFAAEHARHGHELAKDRYDSDRFVAELADRLAAL